MVYEVENSTATAINFSAQMEGDLKSLRQELERTRNALRIQSTRCRQIVAAFTRKLEEKELETRNSRILRDQQLSEVVRALLVLEARLRREQRSIRSLLGERDAVIRSQQLEIARLKKSLNSDSDTSTSTEPIRETIIRINSPAENKADCDVKPDLISSLGIAEFDIRKDNPDDEDAQSNMDSLQLSLYEFESQPDSLLSDLSTQSCNGDILEMFEPSSDTKPPTTNKTNINQNYELSSTNLNSSIIKEEVKNAPNILPRVEIKNNIRDRQEEKHTILTPVKEESINHSFSLWNHDHLNNTVNKETVEHNIETDLKKEIKPLPSTLLQEVRIGSNVNEYENNPVLNCVNQILLRDQEEFLEEQRALRIKGQEKNKIELKQQSQEGSGCNIANKEKQLPPVKKLTFEDKEILIPDKCEFIDSKKSHETKEDVNKEKKLGNSNIQSRNIIPPALPPKPSRLLSKNVDNRLALDAIQQKYLPQTKRMDMKHIEIINKRTSLPNLSTDNELYVISNSAIDDELLQQLQGRQNKICSELGMGLPSNRTRPLNIRSIDGLYTAGSHSMAHPTHKPQEKLTKGVKCFIQTEINAQKKEHNGHNGKEDIGKKACQQQSPTKKTSSPSTIKVASPVSSLIATVETISHDEPRKETSPSVSQIVRRFEDLGSKKETITESGDDTLRKNFEEFRLDDCDMEALCSGLDRGQEKDEEAEERLKEAAAALEARVSYENFLEATGLSQKSIMTPSRMFSNHKSVMKPKDVKHRNRVKAAAVIERCNNPQTLSNSTVRYWTEPFL